MFFNKFKIARFFRLQQKINSRNVSEIDNDVYETVTIGNQTFTKSNLNISHYRNGDVIPQVKDSKGWESLITGAWCYYNNDPANEAIYGKLYNWYAVNDPRGLAPIGWHIPSDKEWTTIINYLGEQDVTRKQTYIDQINIGKVSGSKMKTIMGWHGLNIDVTNSSGFSGLPGGGRNKDGSFALSGENGCWWSISQHDDISSAAYNFSIFNDSSGRCRTNIGADDKCTGFSVRCSKD